MSKTIKIAAWSDYHATTFPEFEPADVMIFAGDITDVWTENMMGQVKQFEDFMLNLMAQAQNFKKIIIVFGNHDMFANYDPHHEEILNWVYDFADLGVELTFLTNEITTYEGITFVGSPYNGDFKESPFAFKWNKKIAKKAYNLITRSKSDIVITHAPVKGILSTNHKGIVSGETVFLDAFNNMDKKPKYWIHGHIHNEYGKKEIDGTTFLNVAYLGDRETRKLNEVVYFEYKKEEEENE